MAEDFPAMAWAPSQRDPISLYPLLLIPIVGLVIGAVLENEGLVSKSGPVAWVLFGVVILAIGVWIVLAEYNYLTYLRNEVEHLWHDIDVQFQRRAALQAELVNSENQIARFRLAYNTVTKFFNTVVDRIPTCVIATMFGVRKADYAGV